MYKYFSLFLDFAETNLSKRRQLCAKFLHAVSFFRRFFRPGVVVIVVVIGVIVVVVVFFRGSSAENMFPGNSEKKNSLDLAIGIIETKESRPEG